MSYHICNVIFNSASEGANYSSLSNDNVNLKVDGSNNELDLTNNVGSKFVGNQNNISARHGVKIKFAGDRNTLKFAHEVGSDVKGDENQCEFLKNVDCSLVGHKNQITFSNNINVRVNGSENVIYASNNTHLRIEGQSNKISISGTKNHHLSIIGGNRNELQVVFGASQNSPTQTVEGGCWINGVKMPDNFTGCTIANGSQITTDQVQIVNNVVVGSPAVKYGINYVKEAVIKNEEYSIGIFKFRMEQPSEQLVVVTFHEANYDIGTFQTTPGPEQNQILVSASKDGENQTLAILAPNVCRVPNLVDGIVFLEMGNGDKLINFNADPSVHSGVGTP